VCFYEKDGIIGPKYGKVQSRGGPCHVPSCGPVEGFIFPPDFRTPQEKTAELAKKIEESKRYAAEHAKWEADEKKRRKIIDRIRKKITKEEREELDKLIDYWDNGGYED